MPAVPEEVRAAGVAGRATGMGLQLAEDLAERAQAARREAALAQADALSAADKARMDAHLDVLRAFAAYQANCGLSAEQARMAFSLAYNADRVPVAQDTRRLVPSISDRSVRRWQAEVRKNGIVALAGAYGNRAGTAVLDADQALHDFVRGMLVATPHCRAAHVLAGLQARFKDRRLPGSRALQRWINAWREDNAEILCALGNPDAWRNKYMTAFGSRSEGIDRVNQLWELDSSPADIMCTDGRYVLVAGIDVRSRMPRIYVAKTSKADAVAALLRRMLLDLGVPERVKTDNGSDYTSRHIVRVLDGLDVPQDLCDPFCPDQKPHIERFFGTFSRGLIELAPGYIGHNVAERKAIEAQRSFAERLMRSKEPIEARCTGKELQAFCDRWVEDVYQHSLHEGLDKRTPFEVCASLGTDRRRIDDERALDVLLAEAPENDGRRTVQKKGIKVDNAWFIAPELHSWVGEQVQVRWDALDHDLGRLYVFGYVAGQGEQQFVCIAECPERTGMDRREVAAKGRTLQRQHMQAARRVLKAAAKRVGTDQVVQEVLRDRAQAAGKLQLMPARGPVHTSAGLAAAANAARTADAPQRTTADIASLADIEAARARLVAEAAPKPQPAAQITRTFESVADRVRWLMQQAQQRELTLEERESLTEYRRNQPASYRRLQLLIAEQAAQTTSPSTDQSTGA